jgi:predicted RNA-binding protein
MCLAKAYLGHDGEGELIIGDVTSIKTSGGKLLLTTLFGERKEIEASIKEIDFRGSKVILESPG